MSVDIAQPIHVTVEFRDVDAGLLKIINVVSVVGPTAERPCFTIATAAGRAHWIPADVVLRVMSRPMRPPRTIPKGTD